MKDKHQTVDKLSNLIMNDPFQEQMLQHNVYRRLTNVSIDLVLDNNAVTNLSFFSKIIRDQ